MAGIAGIIKLTEDFLRISDAALVSQIESNLRIDDRQIVEKYLTDNFFCLVAHSISHKFTDSLIVNDSLGLVAVIEGSVFIEPASKEIVTTEFNLDPQSKDSQLLLFLYKKYHVNMAIHLYGTFNLFIYDTKLKKCLLVNDRWGFLPLYYYQNDKFVIFSSKIECILATGLLNRVEFDRASLAEHLYFNYTLSDNTYIKKIATLPAASYLHIYFSNINKSTYWNIESMLGQDLISDKESLDAIEHAFQKAIDRVASKAVNPLYVSLTGGWDSRLVMSFLLTHYRSLIKCYSFGADNSDDLSIPKQICEFENLDYRKFLLNESYLSSIFPIMARQTVLLSGGTRNYKRSHYLYAMGEIGTQTENVMGGIFGDEILKAGKPIGNAVLSSNTIRLFENEFNQDSFVEEYKRNPVSTLPFFSGENVADELSERIDKLGKIYDGFPRQEEKIYAFRLNHNLRKYFGYEASSYNDFVSCSSPFIDYSFISEFSRTAYSAHRQSFASNKIKTKFRNLELYARLIKNQYPSLLKYKTSSGHNIADVLSPHGKLKILFTRFIHSKSKQDNYFTKDTDSVFRQFLNRDSTYDNLLQRLESEDCASVQADAYSLIYFVQHITAKYL